jgi:hypothetical protein
VKYRYQEKETFVKTKNEVVNPLGRRGIEPLPPAARLDTLEGKTICEISNGGFNDKVSFPLIEQMLKERYPSIKIVPYSEFPSTTINAFWPERKNETLKAVRSAILNNGCDAVITGNGG